MRRLDRLDTQRLLRRSGVIVLVAGVLVVSLHGACTCDESTGGGGQAAAPGDRPLRAKAIAVGGQHACALVEGGKVVCWGGNGRGQLGDGTTTDRPTPHPFDVVGEVEALDAGFGATCARSGSGDVRCAGGPLPGHFGEQHRPTTIPELAGARGLALGRLHGCALDAEGRVGCWGSNYFGQLGDDSARGCGSAPIADRETIGLVPGLTGVASISPGDTGTCALLASGAGVCWGTVGYPLIQGVDTRCRPAGLEGLEGLRQIVVGSHHGCALRESGAVVCWGANAIGQLGAAREGTVPEGHGSGDRPLRLPPVAVRGLDDAVSIASFGRAHSCAVRRSGGVVCWGRNAEGQLGDGTTTSRWAPVAVTGLTDAAAVGAGYGFSCALHRDGRVACWGDNEHGQLGDGTLEQRTSPVEVRGFGGE